MNAVVEHCTSRVAKAKALISFAVTAKLMCAFVLAYVVCCFSYVAAQLSSLYNRIACVTVADVCITSSSRFI